MIAAAIIGGTSIYGGLGTIPGAALGALLLSVLATGLILLNVDPTLQDLATGIVLILAAGLDQIPSPADVPGIGSTCSRGRKRIRGKCDVLPGRSAVKGRSWALTPTKWAT